MDKDITQARMKQHLEEYDLVHYAGHADYNNLNPSLSGWQLKDGKLITSDIVDLAQTVTLPALVFSNSCQSGQTSAWQADDLIKNRIHGLADAFLMSGVQHYVGAFWNVYDRPSQTLLWNSTPAWSRGCRWVSPAPSPVKDY